MRETGPGWRAGPGLLEIAFSLLDLGAFDSGASGEPVNVDGGEAVGGVAEGDFGEGGEDLQRDLSAGIMGEAGVSAGERDKLIPAQRVLAVVHQAAEIIESDVGEADKGRLGPGASFGVGG